MAGSGGDFIGEACRKLGLACGILPYVNTEKARQPDCAVAALERMFAETFDLKLDFVPGDANGAGLESCSDDHLQTALGNALKLGPDCRPLIARFCASGDCIHGVALNWNIGSDWRKVRQVSCPVKEEELKLRPRDSDSHVAPKVFLTGKGHRSAVAKAFRAGKRRRK